MFVRKFLVPMATMALITAGPAWCQSEQEITEALGPQLDAYALCLKKQAQDLAKSLDLDEQVIVNKAISACEAERTALSDTAQKSKLGWSADETDNQIAEMVREIRPQMIQTIKEVRS